MGQIGCLLTKMNSTFTGRWNESLLDENYEQWRRNPQAVDASWAAFFEGFELGCARLGKNGTQPAAVASEGGASSFQTRVDGLIHAYRTLGHTIANIDPLNDEPRVNPLLSLDQLGFSEADLDRTVSSSFFESGREMSLRKLLERLECMYCGTIGVEYNYIQNPRIRHWVRERVENRTDDAAADAEVHRALLKMLFEAEGFENFIHTKYVGSKRFSLEGGESLIVALEMVLNRCEKHGVQEILMGMAHRGRLNVLANFLNKPLHVIFNEFSDDYVPEHTMGSGDVKYHLGFQTTRATKSGHEVLIQLAANPSHLEAVDPVVQGKTRARQRILEDTVERKKVLPVLIHGDAAFAGQGMVAEVLNMSQLQGYRTGGTLHIIVNNQIGFTTLPADARSTPYCTDVAKLVEAPIFHVNGDDPLAVREVAEIALDFRQEFGRDVVIDILCYRRHGHNEGDEPAFTQPNLYSKIKAHPTLATKFSEEVIARGTVPGEEVARIKAVALEELDTAMAEVKEEKKSGPKKSQFAGSTAVYQPPYSFEPANTAITTETLEKIVKALTTVPDNFNVLPKVRRIILERRAQVYKDGGPYNWAFAEALAFGSLLIEGTPVRLSGQDSRRGTFSQRHSVLYDEKNRDRYIPLMNLDPNQARFCVYNSLLSEAAVLGFDYGYSMDFPSMLCLWEAQFGDFSNGAQVIIDQFIASSESKWQRPSSIVLLLPHGYEGQGPEHSSARLERFLQLCAEDNMQVCNFTTPAQYFHALRRQIHRGYRKPLIIMTPKSLLGSDKAVSHTNDFTDSGFSEILPDHSSLKASAVERVILCSGKVYYDLEAFREANGSRAAILRVEQLYPLHEEKLAELIRPYGKAKKVIWCQEEPQNMGAWSFIAPRLEKLLNRPIAYAGREAAASPAAGSATIHKREQTALVKQAFSA